ncbi:hypothetical protein ACFYTC_37905 [Actinomadura nitritigenes]|uniref:hypothetical protein n=1 Tax=Actinomadura nitritigenes TaxID=134602 RepID=UPI00368DE8E1
MHGTARHGVWRGTAHGTARHGARRGAAIPDGDESWCEPLDGDATGAWTKVRAATPGSVLYVPSTRRGVLVVGDGAVNVKWYVAAASMAGWVARAPAWRRAACAQHGSLP